MKKLFCIFLSICSLLTACAVTPKEESAGAASLQPLSDVAQKSEEVQLSCVEVLALDLVKSLGASADQGEAAIRTLYTYLVSNVWFADPVGLDAWRYLTAQDEKAISYLENRALSPLLFHIGSCEDFAAAMVMLLRAAGFEAEYVAGYTLSVGQVYVDHAWAVVQLDGQWYHLDPQLEQNVTRKNELTYRFYLKSDADYSIDHRWGENLIALWPTMPEHEKAAIHEHYTPPACPESYVPAPASVQVALPLRPNAADVERQLAALKKESGKGELAPIWLDVEPPILVERHHITPPLLDQPAAIRASAFRYGRELLSAEEAKKLYDEIWALVDAQGDQSRVAVKGDLPDTEIRAVINAFLSDNPIYYWANLSLIHENGERYIVLSLSISPDEIAQQKKEIDARTAEILAGGSADPFLRALAIYEVVANVPYDYNESNKNSENLYGLLVENKAICYGYAGAYLYLAQQAGLDCIMMKGTNLRGVGHAWNAVMLDGSWHFVDATWGRPLMGEDTVYHDFFLMDEREMYSDRQWTNAQYSVFPSPSDGFSSYYQRMDYAVGGPVTSTAAKEIAAIFYKQMTAKPDISQEPHLSFVEVKVEGTREEYEDWKALYIKAVFEIQQEIQALSDADGTPFTLVDLDSAFCHFNNKMQVLTFYPTVQGTACADE